MEKTRAAVPAVVLVLAGIAVGVGVAAIVTVLQHTRYRAEASLVVQRGTQPVTDHGLVRTVGDLARSDTVATDVARNLALHESTDALRTHMHVNEDQDSAFLLLSADANSRTLASQIVTQLGLVVTQAVRQRFGQVSPTGGEPVQVVLIDQPHVLPGHVSPNLRRNLGFGALFGLVAGLFLANLFAPRRPARVTIAPPPVLGSGADAVAGRLLELARATPFQTVAVAGDDDGSFAGEVADALAARGVTSARAEDADALPGLAARNAFVLVGAGLADIPPTDAVVALADGSPLPLELVTGLRGARFLGVAERSGA